MRLDSSRVRGGNFDEGGKLGSGTRILVEQGRIILEPGQDDIVFLTQDGEKLQIKVNDQETVTFNPIESRNLLIRGHESSVVADESVNIPVPGLPEPPKDVPTPSARSAGFQFRGEYRRWEIDGELEEFHLDVIHKMEEFQKQVAEAPVPDFVKERFGRMISQLRNKIDKNPQKCYESIIELDSIEKEFQQKLAASLDSNKDPSAG